MFYKQVSIPSDTQADLYSDLKTQVYNFQTLHDHVWQRRCGNSTTIFSLLASKLDRMEITDRVEGHSIYRLEQKGTLNLRFFFPKK